ncbi:MAG: hypothetical protein ASARMPREDX12_007616 [Alectoria sarmentosa]|nr:MAG: hypothetical protein ASARMPREDX12_007616 [Alectoria sarmentosa]
MLPNKNRPTPWYSDYYPGSGQNMLSLTRTHGTCQIQLDISGETVIRQNPAWIGRNKVRPMGSWVLFRCGLGNKSELTKMFSEHYSYLSLRMWGAALASTLTEMLAQGSK